MNKSVDKSQFYGLLTPGENILWTGAPDIKKGDHRRRRAALLGNLVWILAALGMATLIISGGIYSSTWDQLDYLDPVNVIDWAFLLVAAVIVLFNLFRIFNRKHYDRSNERYALTNKRLISTNPVTGDTTSVFAKNCTSARVVMDENAMDLDAPNLVISHELQNLDFDLITFWALSDAQEVKRRFLELAFNNPQAGAQ